MTIEAKGTPRQTLSLCKTKLLKLFVVLLRNLSLDSFSMNRVTRTKISNLACLHSKNIKFIPLKRDSTTERCHLSFEAHSKMTLRNKVQAH